MVAVKKQNVSCFLTKKEKNRKNVQNTAAIKKSFRQKTSMDLTQTRRVFFSLV